MGRRRVAGVTGIRRQAEIGEHHQHEDEQHDRAERQRDHEPFARPVGPLVARDDVLEPTHGVDCIKRAAAAATAIAEITTVSLAMGGIFALNRPPGLGP